MKTMKKLIWKNPEPITYTISDENNLFTKLFVDEDKNYTVIKAGVDRYGADTESEKEIQLQSEIYLSVEDILSHYAKKGDKESIELYKKMFGGEDE